MRINYELYNKIKNGDKILCDNDDEYNLLTKELVKDGYSFINKKVKFSKYVEWVVIGIYLNNIYHEKESDIRKGDFVKTNMFIYD